ncbi:hypothetical protein GCM10023329_03320 [Streptomyces sanyensis]|uniref:Uncharacterized protein n=1 Tax=Streptomyces sanyensis TaxID=568869 RepID=A0ABP8ZND5_9ACTN
MCRGEGELDVGITRFGEVLAAYDFVPKPEHDEAPLAACASALDAYGAAKRVLVAARTAAEGNVAVRQALAEGGQALADLDARREADRSDGASRSASSIRDTVRPSPKYCGSHRAARPGRSRCTQRMRYGCRTATCRS